MVKTGDVLYLAAALIATRILAADVIPQETHRLLLNSKAPKFQAQAPERSIVRLETSVGTIDIEVLRAWAPRGADRFVALVRHGYYDVTRFFRVRPGRWVQFGINGDPAIARAWRNETFPDDPFVQSNTRGTVAFPFAVPNGRATQVFINTGDNSASHDKEPFTPFGRVVSGMAAVDAINAEYGEGPEGIRAGKQDAFFEGGNAWLLRQFPRLDYIRGASVLAR
ncbi:MAG TPA: peptidylprolyl isomerase [Vicinamibacterales bacterium]